MLRGRLAVLVQSRGISPSKPDSILGAEDTSLFRPTDRRMCGTVRAVSAMTRASRLSVFACTGQGFVAFRVTKLGEQPTRQPHQRAAAMGSTPMVLGFVYIQARKSVGGSILRHGWLLERSMVDLPVAGVMVFVEHTHVYTETWRFQLYPYQLSLNVLMSGGTAPGLLKLQDDQVMSSPATIPIIGDDSKVAGQIED